MASRPKALERDIPGAIHPVFDLEVARTELLGFIEEATDSFVSPLGIVQLEERRRRLKLDERLREQLDPKTLEWARRETDVFAFGVGPPPDPRGTMIGGMPFWPGARPWPNDSSGRPMWVIGQLNFADSLDLVGETETPLAVLFCSAEGDSLYEDEGVHIAWLRGDETNLLAEFPEGAASLPEGQWYGVRHRTFDLLDHSADVHDVLLSLDPALDRELMRATRIHGFSHGGDDEPECLAILNSLQAISAVPWSFTNRRGRLSLSSDKRGIYSRKNSWGFGDLGSITLKGECGATRAEIHIGG